MIETEKIRALLVNGNIEEALDMLSKFSVEAVMLRSRFSNLRKEIRIGTIDPFRDRTESNKIIHSALEILQDLEKSQRKTKKLEESFVHTRGIHGLESLASTEQPQILLAYHVSDRDLAQHIKSFLRRNDFEGYIDDYQSLIPIQDLLQAFLLKKGTISNHFFIPIISKRSLREGWIGFQHYLDYFSNALIYKNAIPVSADDDWWGLNIYKEIERLDDRIEELEEEIGKYPDTSLRQQHLRTELIALRNNLPQIMQRLKNTSVLNADDDHFDISMRKVLNTINESMQKYQSAVF
jgi:hypothetical protein